MTATPVTNVSTCVRREVLENGAIWRLVLATPKANVLDAAKIAELAAAYRAASSDRKLACIVITGEGPHFSFGASVEEHLPSNFAAMLASFHGLFRLMLETGVPTLAAVRGQCLGGALELASFSTRVFASPDAKLGQPEIKLGVIAPSPASSCPCASAAPRPRTCASPAVRSPPSKRSLSVSSTRSPTIRTRPRSPGRSASSCPLSASSLRLAQRAVRLGLASHFDREIQHVERLYRDELMKTADAVEGLNAFLEKRAPLWSHA